MEIYKDGCPYWFETTNNDMVSIRATQPLTSDEAWPVKWRLWKSGEVVLEVLFSVSF
jgi:hypothetical protein